jgi:antitoxin YefM
MRRAHLAEDIRPLSEFRANAAALVERVRATKRPLVLTQRGHSAAVVVDVAEYEHLLEQLEMLLDLQTAQRQIEAGQGIPHAEARERILAELEP